MLHAAFLSASMFRVLQTVVGQVRRFLGWIAEPVAGVGKIIFSSADAPGIEAPKHRQADPRSFTVDGPQTLVSVELS